MLIDNYDQVYRTQIYFVLNSLILYNCVTLKKPWRDHRRTSQKNKNIFYLELINAIVKSGLNLRANEVLFCWMETTSLFTTSNCQQSYAWRILWSGINFCTPPNNNNIVRVRALFSAVKFFRSRCPSLFFFHCKYWQILGIFRLRDVFAIFVENWACCSAPNSWKALSSNCCLPARSFLHAG